MDNKGHHKAQMRYLIKDSHGPRRRNMVKNMATNNHREVVEVEVDKVDQEDQELGEEAEVEDLRLKRKRSWVLNGSSSKKLREEAEKMSHIQLTDLCMTKDQTGTGKSTRSTCLKKLRSRNQSIYTTLWETTSLPKKLEIKL